MPGRKPPKNYPEWWKNFSRELFKTSYVKNTNILKNDLKEIAAEIAERYPLLSADHIYHLVKEIARCISFEFRSARASSDEGMLMAVLSFRQIIEHGALFCSPTDSSSLMTLSKLNASNIKTIEWFFYSVIGTPNGLERVSNPADYKAVIKSTFKELAILYLTHFYNFLATKPELTENQWKIVTELRAGLTQWQTFFEKEKYPTERPYEIAGSEQPHIPDETTLPSKINDINQEKSTATPPRKLADLACSP
jgi:hypothetical protein